MVDLTSSLHELDRQIRIALIADKKHTVAWNFHPCPVCGTNMNYDSDFMEHIQLEEHSSCPNRCYSYEFVTGSTRTRIGSIEVIEHYSDSDEEREYKTRLMNLALIYERGNRNVKDAGGHKSETDVQDSAE